jgi:hypothetical protein
MVLQKDDGISWETTEISCSKTSGLDDTRGADKSLARTGRKQAMATEDFDFHISYL